MSAIETYQPLAQFVAFMAGWGLCILTGLLLVKIAE